MTNERTNSVLIRAGQYILMQQKIGAKLNADLLKKAVRNMLDRILQKNVLYVMQISAQTLLGKHAINLAQKCYCQLR